MDDRDLENEKLKQQLKCQECKCKIRLEILKLIVTPRMLITIAFVVITIIQMIKGV